MSDGPLTNAAARWTQRAFEFIEEMGPPAGGRPFALDDVKKSVAAGFVVEDLRSGLNAPRLEGPAEWTRMLNATFESGDPPPRWVLMDVIAVRGERTAVLAFRIDYGNDTYIDTIDVVQLAEDLHRLHRIVEFDPDDLDAALAEADRLFLEDEGRDCRVIHELSTRALTERYTAADPATGDDELFSEDFRVRDHRPVGAGELDRSTSMDFMNVAAEHPGARTQRVRRLLAFTEHARLAETVLRAGDLEWNLLILFAREGGQVCLAEIWEIEDVDAAMARFKELTV